VSARVTDAQAAWLRPAILFGLGYFLVGRLFAVPGEHAQAWRFAAWIVSFLIYATHFRYERARSTSPPRVVALHVATAVAIGAFGIAVAGMMRSVATLGSLKPTWLLALVLFPLVTAMPAFLVALVAAVAMARRGQSTH
jgi:hypothetical protein